MIQIQQNLLRHWEKKSDQSDLTQTDELAVYREFYEKYVTNEALDPVKDGTVDAYDYNNGYDKDMLLGAYMQDFGGDGTPGITFDKNAWKSGRRKNG